MRLRREWLARVALLILSPLVFFLLLEIGLRIAGFGYPATFLVPLPDRDAYITNEKFGWRFFPRVLARAPAFELLREAKPPNAYRIFVLGESAAMGVPEPAFSFGRVLEALLRERYPGVGFEVINAAMTGINSHAILPIARDCAQHGPDLFVIYTGNNEVVGPYGPGTVFSPIMRQLSLIRLSVWQTSTRTGQLLASAASSLRTTPAEFAEWRGMEMFLNRQVAADDPRLETTYAHFRNNLTDICRTGKRSGAAVIVSTVATNLGECPPFASVAARDLGQADLSKWQSGYKAGVDAEAAADWEGALAAYASALAVDEGYAELHYRMGRCLKAVGEEKKALDHFRRARDLDALRFRADSEINRIIRDVAANVEAVTLADSESAFALLIAGGQPESELFHEHVHLTFAGNYLLARTVAERFAEIAPTWIRIKDHGVFAERERIAALLSYTAWDEQRIAAQMHAMMDRPPFTNQLNYQVARRERLRKLRDMKSQATSKVAMQRALGAYSDAITGAPDDFRVRLRYAELLRDARFLDASAREWRKLIQTVPGIKTWHASLAAVLTDQDQLDAAIREYTRALEIDSNFDIALFGLGIVYARQQDFGRAIGHFRKAIEMNPAYAEVHNNLGLALVQAGDVAAAIESYRQAIRLRPDYSEAHNNLALAYLAGRKTDEAVTEFREAVQVQPEFAGAHYNLAGTLAKLGKPAEAILHFEEALRLKPDYPEAHFGLAGLLVQAGDAERAAKHYSAALETRPEFADAHYNLGLILSRQGKLEVAIRHYAEALRLKPDSADIHNNFGTTLARLGNYDEAATHFRRALELQPDLAAARSNLEKVLRAVAAAGR